VVHIALKNTRHAVLLRVALLQDLTEKTGSAVMNIDITIDFVCEDTATPRRESLEATAVEPPLGAVF
jgi:hypothetical protein